MTVTVASTPRLFTSQAAPLDDSLAAQNAFQRRIIEAAFLLESSFVAVTAIVVGTALGLVLGYNIIGDSAKQPSWDTLTLTVPWLNLGGIFLVVYGVALLTTLAPALRASRIQPAEALRYQ
jgi:ABC-type antimicrobial peptide transport system permease subunit